MVCPNLLGELRSLLSEHNSTTIHDIPHLHDRDVFEELDTSRRLSWQYELQQLNVEIFGSRTCELRVFPN